MCAPLVDCRGSTNRARSKCAGFVELHCGLGYMVALLGSKLSVFSCSVLYGDSKISMLGTIFHCITYLPDAFLKHL